MTKDQEAIKIEIYDRIEADDGFAIASLLHVYSFQLEDEKDDQKYRHHDSPPHAVQDHHPQGPAVKNHFLGSVSF